MSHNNETPFIDLQYNDIHPSCNAKAELTPYEELAICNCLTKPNGTTVDENGDRICCFDKEFCLNAATMTECNRAHCNYDMCQNQFFTKRSFAKLDVKETPGKGHGLFTKQDLKSRQFIREYVGEIISAKELALRKERTMGNRHLFLVQKN